MKIYLSKLAVATALAFTAGAMTAQAANVNSLVRNGPNSASDENREYLLDRNLGAVMPDGTIAAPGQIDVGDSLRGMVNINTMNSAGANLGGLTPNDELTGVFQAMVVGMVNLGTPAVPLWSYRFAPDPAFEAIYGAGAIAAIYTDPSKNATQDFDDPPPATPGALPASDDGTPGRSVPPSSADVSSGLYVTEEAFIGTHTDGLLWAVLGFLGLPGEGFDGLGSAPGVPNNILASFGFTSGTAFINNNLGLNLLSTGAGWDPNITINRVTPSIFCAGCTTDFAISGQTRGVFDLDTPFESSSNLNISFNATRVPEPGTLALLGFGLAGLGFARRRQTKG